MAAELHEKGAGIGPGGQCESTAAIAYQPEASRVSLLTATYTRLLSLALPHIMPPMVPPGPTFQGYVRKGRARGGEGQGGARGG